MVGGAEDMSLLRRKQRVHVSEEEAVGDAVRFVDERLGVSPLIKSAMGYLFPDHWTFLFGEIALYSFLVLLITGTYLAFFFDPSTATTQYVGSYAPLHGVTVSEAYNSTLGITFDVPAGLTIRQTHHWAALVFVVAMIVHLMRVFFSGAFRKPRDINWIIGVTLVALGMVEGFAGYSLPDDLLSGIGLAIAYGVVLSIPFVGGQLAVLIWDGNFPGSSAFIDRLFIVHVFIVPIVIMVLIGIHLWLITRRRHSQFPGKGRTERNVVGTPLWPAYTFRALGMLLATAGVLFLLGGLIQINPIWQYGPYEPYLGTNGAQPDWYMGWLIGALRLMPGFDFTIGNATVAPNPFFGGILFPTVVFSILYGWPAIERRITKDKRRHDLLDRPRDKPWRTAFGAAFFTWIFTIFVAGAADRILVDVGFPYEGQVIFFRITALVLPVIVFVLTYLVCKQLKASEARPLRRWSGTVVRRRPDGGYDEVPVEVESGNGIGTAPASEADEPVTRPPS
jgi:ubiquinol-cytochrome c reductase cytochrome b subunit